MSKSFKDLVAFQRAMNVVVAVYDITERFPRSELYGLTAQLKRAALSVISNIAEGQGRLTNGEWRNSLSDARGSLYEVEAQCIAAEHLHFINERELQELTVLIRKAGKALSGFIAWVYRNGQPPHQPRYTDPATKQLRNPATHR